VSRLGDPLAGPAEVAAVDLVDVAVDRRLLVDQGVPLQQFDLPGAGHVDVVGHPDPLREVGVVDVQLREPGVEVDIREVAAGCLGQAVDDGVVGCARPCRRRPAVACPPGSTRVAPRPVASGVDCLVDAAVDLTRFGLLVAVAGCGMSTRRSSTIRGWPRGEIPPYL
jgi:hypothetical protein